MILKKVLGVTSMVLLTAGMLTGCGSPTPEKLLGDASANMGKIKSYTGQVEGDMTVGASASGVNYGIDINMDFDLEMLTEPEIMHMDGTVGIDLMNMALDMDMYMENDPDKKEATVYLNIADEWAKETIEIDDDKEEKAEDLNDEIGGILLGESDFKLAEETEQVNGQEAYVLTTTLTGDQLQTVAEKAIKSMESSENPMDNIDFSDMSMDVTVKIYKDSKLPAVYIYTLKEGGKIAESDGSDITIDAMEITMTMEDYDKLDEIEIPDEAQDAEDMGNTNTDLLDQLNDEDDADSGSSLTDSILGDDTSSDTESEDSKDTNSVSTDDSDSQLMQDEDGNYVLTDYNEEVYALIPPLDGYKLSEYSDSTGIAFSKTEDESSITISYDINEYDDRAKEEMPKSLDYISELTDIYEKIEVQEVQNRKVDDCDVEYVAVTYKSKDSGIWYKDYMAWTVMDETYVLAVKVSSTAYESADDVANDDVLDTIYKDVTL